MFRKQIFRLLLTAAFTAAAVLSSGITIRESISLRELLFVICSAAVLSGAAVFDGTEETFRGRAAVFGAAFKRYVFFTGAFLTVLLVLAAVSNPSPASEGEKELSFRTFVVKIVLGLRPLLYGTALHILCSLHLNRMTKRTERRGRRRLTPQPGQIIQPELPVLSRNVPSEFMALYIAVPEVLSFYHGVNLKLRGLQLRD